MNHEQNISTAVMAQLIGVSERLVRDLAARGIIVCGAKRGTYRLAASIKAYCAHLREIAAGRGGESGVVTLTAERARLAREQADAMALKNAVSRGKMVGSDAVEKEWAAILGGVRSRMLAVSSRVAQRIPHFTAGDVSSIDAEIRAGLKELGEDNVAA